MVSPPSYRRIAAHPLLVSTIATTPSQAYGRSAGTSFLYAPAGQTLASPPAKTAQYARYTYPLPYECTVHRASPRCHLANRREDLSKMSPPSNCSVSWRKVADTLSTAPSYRAKKMQWFPLYSGRCPICRLIISPARSVSFRPMYLVPETMVSSGCHISTASHTSRQLRLATVRSGVRDALSGSTRRLQ